MLIPIIDFLLNNSFGIMLVLLIPTTSFIASYSCSSRKWTYIFFMIGIVSTGIVIVTGSCFFTIYNSKSAIYCLSPLRADGTLERTFKHLESRQYIEITREYALEKVLGNYVDIKNLSGLNNLEINQFANNLDTLLYIKNHYLLTEEQKKEFTNFVKTSNLGADENREIIEGKIKKLEYEFEKEKQYKKKEIFLIKQKNLLKEI